MDDLMLNSSSSKLNLLSLKGKDWSSLQNLDSEDSEETNSEANYQNGYLNLNRMSLVNGVGGGGSGDFTATTNSSDSNLATKQHHQHDTMRLNKDDMGIYGLRPASDQFYLVVCELCGKVFKPQALSRHIEIRHSNESEIGHTAIHNDPLDNLRQVRSEESSSLTEEDFNSNRTPSDNLRSLLLTSSTSLLATATTKDDLDLEKLKQRQQSLLSSKSNSSSNSTTASSPLNLPSAIDANSIAIKKITKPKLLPCKDRKYDADKHCGVRSNDSEKPCTRSLTCKTHSLPLRRAVQGRRDSFDNLLSEHRLAKEAALRAAGVEVKPTKLQLKQQQRMQKNILLKEQQAQKEASSSFKDLHHQHHQTNSNSSSLSSSNPPAAACTNNTQFKIHLQPLNSPSSSLTTSPSFKAFNQLHQQQEPTSIFAASSSNNNKTNFNQSTALQSPTTNSFVNISNLSQFTSPTGVKQFTFGNNQQLGKLLSSPSRSQQTAASSHPFNNNTSNLSPSSTNQQPGILSSSIQAINQTNLMNSNNNNYFDAPKNHSSSTSSSLSLINHNHHHQNNQRPPFICDLSPTTLNHCPKPAAVCTFNERRLSIFTQSSNKQILSSKLFNRKQDSAYSALSVFCNKEKMLNDQNSQLNQETSELNNNNHHHQNTTPVKQQTKNKFKGSSVLLSNSQSNSQTDFYSSNSNSQESYQHQTPCASPFDRNGLSSPSTLSRKSSAEMANDHPIAKSYLYSGFNNRSSIVVVSEKSDADRSAFNNV